MYTPKTILDFQSSMAAIEPERKVISIPQGMAAAEPAITYTLATPRDDQSHIMRTRNTTIPRRDDTTVLGIWISCHGRVKYPIKLVKNIPDVEISKYTYSGFCAGTIIVTSYPREFKEQRALSLLHDFGHAYTSDQYLLSLNKSACTGVDIENSCKLFTNPPKGWVEKWYISDTDENHTMILAYNNKTIDLMKCSIKELSDFVENDPMFNVIIAQFIETRDSSDYITTSTLFLLIKAFKNRKKVRTVRILDESCNEGEDVLVDPDIGYGGKKSKKRSITSRRKSVSLARARLQD
jgi:hypothetical protein